MAGKISMKGCTFENCGVGISIPNNSQVNFELETTDFVNCGKAIEERDLPNLFSALHFLPDTPPEKILDLLTQIANDANTSHQAIETNVSKMGLFDFIGIGADISTITQTLIELKTNGRLQTIINSITNLL